MNNNELEQAHNLLLETAEVMTQFRQSTHQIVQNLEDKLDKSLYDQRKMITEMVRAEVTKENVKFGGRLCARYGKGTQPNG